jgi:cytochrome b561
MRPAAVLASICSRTEAESSGSATLYAGLVLLFLFLAVLLAGWIASTMPKPEPF